MPDLTARITEILRGNIPVRRSDCKFGVSDRTITLTASELAQAAEEHYRPRITSPEQLDALPDLSIVGLRMTSEEAPEGALFAIQKDADWLPVGDDRELPLDKVSEVIAQGGSVLLWSPGAGE